MQMKYKIDTTRCITVACRADEQCDFIVWLERGEKPVGKFINWDNFNTMVAINFT
jgi:hypothetical protein